MTIMDYVQYALNSYAVWFFACAFFGAVIGLNAKKILMNTLGYTKIVFIDTGESTIQYGRKGLFKTKDREYVISDEFVRNNTIFFDSRFAEPVTFSPTIYEEENGKKVVKWKYWIQSKTFFRVFESKVLEKMMLISAQNYIQIILILSGLSLLMSMLCVYLVYTLSGDVEGLVSMVTELKSKLLVGGR